jgi:hypothetical protein
VQVRSLKIKKKEVKDTNMSRRRGEEKGRRGIELKVT